MPCMLWTRSRLGSRCNYVFYIVQYLHLDLRQYLVHNIHGIVIYIPYYDCAFSLQMVFIPLTLTTRMIVRPGLPLDLTMRAV